jgi:hypothetical protein
MRNKQTYAVLFILTALSGILSVAFSSQIGSITIYNGGSISTNNVTAKSGSPNDIQAAVDAVHAAGGGTVYIPAGHFTFNPPINGVGVTIPATVGRINIIGAGAGITILQETQNANSGTTVSWMFSCSGRFNNGATQGGPIRISGISFVGFVINESATFDSAIYIAHVTDFRIDHCSFQDFTNTAIETSDASGNTHSLITRGVIDHCSIDNPYRDRFEPHGTGNAGNPDSLWALWGYGIIVIGDGVTWDTNIADYLGNYYPTVSIPTWGGARNATQAEPQPVYIENCNFSRTRHAISANGGAYYISRYNYFEKAFAGQNDGHGNNGQDSAGALFGTRCIESYSNIFNFTDESYSFGNDVAVYLRGGGGVCWNNTAIFNPAYNAASILFGNDGEGYPYDDEQFYAWNNTAMYTNGTTINFNSRIQTWGGADVTVNVNYFLFAPNGTSTNGLTGPASYIPYTYPHPFTQTS